MKQKKNFFWRWESDYNTGSPHYRTAIWNQGKFAKMCLCINNKGCFFWPLLLLLWPENVLWLCRVLPKCYVIFNHNDPSDSSVPPSNSRRVTLILEFTVFWSSFKLVFLVSSGTNTPWKVSKYGAFSGLYIPAFGLNKERYSVSLRIQSECGKIRTKKNSVFGRFSRSESFHLCKKTCE